MTSPRSHRRVTEEKNRKEKLPDKSALLSTSDMLLRPRTVPDFLSGKVTSGEYSPELQVKPKLTKLLLNVTIQRSLGSLQILISPESTVDDLIAASIRQYKKEARRPALSSANFSDYDLHYSQFSLQSLDGAEKLMTLGTRNFFLCPKKLGNEGGDLTASSSTWTKQLDSDDIIIDVPWAMDFLL